MKNSIFFKRTILFLTTLMVHGELQAQVPAPVNNGNKWGYIKEGSVRVEVKGLKHAEPFRHGFGVANKGGKWGAYDESLKLVVPFSFDRMEVLANKLVIAQKEGTLEVFNQQGEKVGPGKYSDVALLKGFRDTMTIADQKGRYGIMTASGDVVVPCTFSSPPEHLRNKNFLRVYRKKKNNYLAGVIDITGEVLVPTKYLFVDQWYDSLFRCERENKEVVFRDRKGIVIEGEGERLGYYDDQYVIMHFKDHQMLTIRSTQKQYRAESWAIRESIIFGKIDSEHTQIFFPNGHTMLRSGHYVVHSVKDGVVRIEQTDVRPNIRHLWSIDGVQLISGAFYNIPDWNKRWAIVQTPWPKTKTQVMDLETGQLALQDSLDGAALLPCYRFQATVNGTTRTFDSQMNEVAENKYGAPYVIIPPSDKVQLDQKYKYKSGRSMEEDRTTEDDCEEQRILDGQFKYFDLITDWYGKNPVPNRIKVTKVGDNRYYYGLIDFDGKVVVPFIQAGIRFHDNGWIEVAKIDTLDIGTMQVWGVMRANGDIVIEPKYEEIKRIAEDVAIGVYNGLYNLVDLRTGTVMVENCSGIRYNDRGVFHVGRNHKSGVIDPNGKVIVPIKYDDVSFYPDDAGLFTVERDGKKFYVDMNGNELPHE